MANLLKLHKRHNLNLKYRQHLKERDRIISFLQQRNNIQGPALNLPNNQLLSQIKRIERLQNPFNHRGEKSPSLRQRLYQLWFYKKPKSLKYLKEFPKGLYLLHRQKLKDKSHLLNLTRMSKEFPLTLIFTSRLISTKRPGFNTMSKKIIYSLSNYLMTNI